MVYLSRSLYLAMLVLIALVCNTGMLSASSHLPPAEKRSLRSFDNGGRVLLLDFSTVKKSSNMEDRVIAHFDLAGLTGSILDATLHIPVNNFDPGPPEGIFAVYTFSGDGTVSTDEWGAGYNYHVFSNIPGNRDTLTVSIRGILQQALDEGDAYLSFGFRIRSGGKDRFWLDKSNRVAETYITYQASGITLAGAVANGLVHSYVYTWDGDEYVPIHISDTGVSIQPWQGFWMLLPNTPEHSGEEIELYIPKRDNPPNDIPPLVVSVDELFLISPPLRTVEEDLNNSSLGRQLGRDLYESRWHIRRWDAQTGRNHLYTGPDPQFDELMSLRPGKGFFLQLFNSNPLRIDLEGEKVDPADGFFSITLPYGSSGAPYTRHMLGNPYWYPVKWSDFKVYVPLSDSSLTAKNELPEATDTWHIDLSLTTSDGLYRDTRNRLGVVEQGSAEFLRAIDIAPPGRYVRLSLSDPEEHDSSRYAYDYRTSAGSDDVTYTWEIEMTTTLPMVPAVLSIENLGRMPEKYMATLVKDNGESITLDHDTNLQFILYSNRPRTYTLQAHVPAVSVESDLAPGHFGITGVAPNPFNADVSISFSLDRPGRAQLTIYNISGQIVATLLDGMLERGIHRIAWNGRSQSSGVYIARLVSGGRNDVRKMVLVK